MLINTEAKAIAKDLNLNERIEQNNQNQSFFTLKNDKEDFRNKPKYRLINPAKSEIRIVSKHINKSIRERLNANLWRSTQAVMTWFKNIQSKSSSSFIKFNIIDFYPSMWKDLSLKAINFAKPVAHIKDKFTETIFHSRIVLLFNKNDVWIKKDNPDFVSQLVGLNRLDILTKEFGHDQIGLYWDNELSCFQNLSGTDSEKVKKKLCKSLSKMD